MFTFTCNWCNFSAINATSGSDVIHGTTGRDVIHATTGSDVICYCWK